MESPEDRTKLICAVCWRMLVRLTLLSAAVYLLAKFGPYILIRLSSIFVSVVAAIVLTYALLPAVDWLATRPFRRVQMGPRTQRLLATIVVFVAFLGLVALSISLFITPFQLELEQFSSKIGDYTSQLGDLFRSISHWY